MNAIKKISPDGVVLATYKTGVTPTFYPPLQLAFDGTYIWVACGNAIGTLLKMNKDTGVILGTYHLNPTALGLGGVQGIVFDGTNICVGVAQQGGRNGQWFCWESQSCDRGVNYNCNGAD